jgi:hypothetical protein
MQPDPFIEHARRLPSSEAGWLAVVVAATGVAYTLPAGVSALATAGLGCASLVWLLRMRHTSRLQAVEHHKLEARLAELEEAQQHRTAALGSVVADVAPIWCSHLDSVSKQSSEATHALLSALTTMLSQFEAAGFAKTSLSGDGTSVHLRALLSVRFVCKRSRKNPCFERTRRC